MNPTLCEQFNSQLRQKSDRLIDSFPFLFFMIGELLALYFETWYIATLVGSLCMLAYYSCRLLFKNSVLYQYVLSGIMGIFTVQFIYQVDGMFEMRFFGFISSVILITYRNWKLQIPLAIIILTHTTFSYLQLPEFEKLHFSKLGMTLDAFIIQLFFTISIFSLSGVWSHLINISDKKRILQSFEIGKLQEANDQKQILLAIGENLTVSNARLSEANHELNTIFNSIDEALYSVDIVNSRVIFVSVACEKISGYSPASFLRDIHFWETLIHPHDRHITSNNSNLLKEKRIVINRYRIIHKNKSIRWIESKLIPSFNSEGRLIRVDGITKDMSEQVKLENKIGNDFRLRNKQITDAVITAQEKERLYLGQELHDNINPTLAAIRLYLDCAIKDESLREMYITDCKKFTGEVMEEIRNLSRSLVPPSLGELGLKEALADLTENFKKVSDLKFINSWSEMNENILSSKLQLTIFRIVQEQMNNILKHAKATTVTITLKQSNREICLEVSDDGIGFDTSTKSKGVGLQNIISRSELFSGRVKINSRPGQGCELLVRFPLSNVIEIQEMRNAS